MKDKYFENIKKVRRFPVKFWTRHRVSHEWMTSAQVIYSVVIYYCTWWPFLHNRCYHWIRWRELFSNSMDRPIMRLCVQFSIALIAICTPLVPSWCPTLWCNAAYRCWISVQVWKWILFSFITGLCHIFDMFQFITLDTIWLIDMGFLEVLHDFAGGTSIHGFTFLVDKRSSPRTKLFWTFSLIVALTYASLEMRNSVIGN